jgi:hypothetical protein
VLGARPRREETTSQTFTRSERSRATKKTMVFNSDSGPAACRASAASKFSTAQRRALGPRSRPAPQPFLARQVGMLPQ